MKVEQIWRHGPAKVDGVTGPGRTTGSAHLEVTVDESVRSAIVPVVSAIDLYRSLGHWLATNGLITAETIKHTPPGGASVKDVLSRLLDAVMDAAEERWGQGRFR